MLRYSHHENGKNTSFSLFAWRRRNCSEGGQGDRGGKDYRKTAVFCGDFFLVPEILPDVLVPNTFWMLTIQDYSQDDQ